MTAHNRCNAGIAWRHSLALGSTIFTLAGCVSRQVGVLGANGRFPATADVSRLSARLEAFAHDSMEGRASGTRGHDRAASYIAAEAARIGLEPAGENGTFFQIVPLVRRHVSERTRISVEGDALALWDDVVPFLTWLPTREFDGAETIFAGATTDTVGGVKLSADAVRGRVVVFATGLNQRSFRAGGFPKNHPLSGAAAILTVAPAATLARFSALGRPAVFGLAPTDTTLAIPQMLISARAAEAMFGVPLATVTIGAVGRQMRGALAYDQASAASRNVVAELRGSDARRAEEYVVLGAHSDHLGIVPRSVDHDSAHAVQAVEWMRTLAPATDPDDQSRRAQASVPRVRQLAARRDSIANGADDNASGSMALLSAAEILVRNRPGRSVLFVWHTGEERGLIGSEWFTNRPTVSRSAMVALINLDMIGRGAAHEADSGGPSYVEVIGSRRLSSTFGQLLDDVNARLASPLALRYALDRSGHPQQLYCRSDHAMYARFGIPVAFLTTGMHGDYHKATDEDQYLDVLKVARIAHLVARSAHAIGNAAARPFVDGAVSGPDVECQQ